jgi:hypothetical protein
VVEVGVGEQMRGELAAGELAGEAAAAPTHPGVEDNAAEQVDVEGAAGPPRARARPGANWCSGCGSSRRGLGRARMALYLPQ